MEAQGLDRGAMVEHRSRAQLYALVIGLTLTLVGIVGFFVNSSFDTGSALEADKLILFDVNGWHNIVHLASGLVGLAMAGNRASARMFALGFGLVYSLVTVWGLIDSSILGIVPTNDADHVLHAVIALAGIGAYVADRGGDDSY